MDSKRKRVRLCVSFSPKQNTYKTIIKTISRCYILRMLIQKYAEDFHGMNITNQSKLQGKPPWGLGGNTIIVLFSCDFEVFFGNMVVFSNGLI